MNKAEVVETMTLAQALIRSYRMPTDPAAFDFERDVWLRQLGDLDVELVQAVLEAAAASEDREWALNPAQLRNRVTVHIAGRAPTVVEAWLEVKQQIRAVGRNAGLPGASPLTFSHPAIAATVSAMSWLDLCDSELDAADRSHFKTFYEARVNADRAVIAIPPAARAVLDAHAPHAIEPAATAIEIPAVVDREPTDGHLLDPDESRRRLAQEITGIRAMRELERTEPPRSSLLKWQEGDPIDVEHRGIEPAAEPPAEAAQ